MSRLKPLSIDTPVRRALPDADAPRGTTRAVRACVVLGLAVPLLTGCGLFGGGAKKCHERQGYESARSVPPLKSADGTPVQATRNALKIPEVSQTARERAAGDPCLDEPPSFYPGRPKPGQGAVKAEPATGTGGQAPDAMPDTKPDAVPASRPQP